MIEKEPNYPVGTRYDQGPNGWGPNMIEKEPNYPKGTRYDQGPNDWGPNMIEKEPNNPIGTWYQVPDMIQDPMTEHTIFML